MARRKVLSGYTVFVDGVDYVGVASGFTPPTIESENVTSNMPGHGGAFDIPTGRLGALEAVVSMADSFPELEALAANPASVDTPVLFVGVTTDGAPEGGQRSVEYELTGLWSKQERSEFSGPEGSAGGGGGGGGAGERGPCTYTVSVRVMTHRIDGAEIRHIDFEQNIHRAGGADLTAALRTALRRG